MDKNILLKIQYDGTNFWGWQRQPDFRTVQGEIEHVLTFLAGREVLINGTSRTDRGVHALGQCASFVWDFPLPTEKLPFILNKRFGAGGIGRSGAPGDIRILEAKEMPLDFHARFSCKGKTYRYIIERDGDIFRRNQVFQLSDELDHSKMREAAEYIVGTHDFKSFEASGGHSRETTVRTISDLQIEEHGTRTIIEVTGDGFLYNMVRIMVGTLVEVGTGKKSPEDVEQILSACDRQQAGFTAPPQGLYLKEIYF
jgi:tRNA pseudouridine38-40 synthase